MAGTNYTAKGYCTEVDIENLLLTNIDNSFSGQIEDWIAAAEQYIDNYLGYTTASGILAEQIVNETSYGKIDTDLNLVIFPRKIPVISISALSVTKGTSSVAMTLTDANNNPTYDIPSSNDMIILGEDQINSGTSLIRSFAGLRTTRFFTKISYIAGFTSVPADIRLATANLVAETIMRHTNKEGLNMLIQGRVTKKWDDRRFKDTDYSVYKRDAMELLKPYRMATRWI